MVTQEYPRKPASAVLHSRGRRYEGDTPDAYRDEFQRDVGRILYCKAFRRLAYKTQVLSPIEGDHFRNRLTHTLEVAQMAKAISRVLGFNETLTEALALAHDLGHPPFGHQGEAVLDRLLTDYGGFDHNLQNLRIVTILEKKSHRYPGLNVTLETLWGIAKGKKAKQFLRQLYGVAEQDQVFTVESAISDLADDFSYTVHDLDDYVRYHKLNLDQVRRLPLDMVQTCLPDAAVDLNTTMTMWMRNAINLLVTDAIETSRERLAALLDETDPHQVAGCLGLSPEVERSYQALRHFLYTKMYRDINLKGEALRGTLVLEQLFHHYVKKWELQPGDTQGYLRLSDYLSGMTDRYAIAAFQDIYIPRSPFTL